MGSVAVILRCFQSNAREFWGLTLPLPCYFEVLHVELSWASNVKLNWTVVLQAQISNKRAFEPTKKPDFFLENYWKIKRTVQQRDCAMYTNVIKLPKFRGTQRHEIAKSKPSSRAQTPDEPPPPSPQQRIEKTTKRMRTRMKEWGCSGWKSNEQRRRDWPSSQSPRNARRSTANNNKVTEMWPQARSKRPLKWRVWRRACDIHAPDDSCSG